MSHSLTVNRSLPFDILGLLCNSFDEEAGTIIILQKLILHLDKSFRSVSEYTENSELVKSYGEGGKILGISEFDKKGNLTKWFEYDNNGELKRYYVYEYNSFKLSSFAV